MFVHATRLVVVGKRQMGAIGAEGVALMITVTVTAERGDGVWALESSNEAVSQVGRLSDARAEMLEAVAFQAGVPESEITINLEVVPSCTGLGENRSEMLH